MAQKVIKVDCQTASNPRLYEGKLQIFVNSRTCWEINPNDAKKFCTMTICHDATVPSRVIMSCILQIGSSDRDEYLFEFPMDQSVKALEWFHIINEILTPEKRGFFKWTAKVVPSRS